MIGYSCRSCGATLHTSFCDLGMSPLSNAFVAPQRLGNGETFYPLQAFVCDSCFLVQLAEFESPENIFGDYLYFSSFSTSWLDHAKRYVEEMTQKLSLGGSSQVVELASNDGYLLQYFVAKGIPALGIEPAANVAEVARAKGVPTHVDFFGAEVARRLRDDGKAADLLLGNNVLAHVPALNDFVEGIAILLKPDGRVTMEFPHLLRLIESNQFDTIYHEHFSYLSLTAVDTLFRRHGLVVVDVDELPTHGGSLRIHARHAAAAEIAPSVPALLDREQAHGLRTIETYTSFDRQVQATKRALLTFLIKAKSAGKSIVGYGAAAKGNTLLNFCGIRSDFVDYVADRSPHKQGLYLPGTHIPVVAPERIAETKPDYVLILPWNLREEIADQLAFVREWGGRFVVPIPNVQVF
ncbi:methyltransferase family protein [Rhodopseudomonas thermotolerans]|uniref:Methyltransferase family protein n=2 Tax=Rhodopseudomonas TaxID=1073 RepID=A0A336JPL7_9BRAD|nr:MULTISPECIES: class I SAM-dependent methyltransferase [Rhodopseudomonas]RED37974.1 methyltransferase family protein [Rhodopseudomonas pentothenatexigens]REG05167.1 methyltransferase family protein [Rhodopseudomonas thermotolerans]SSW89999.1 methyltransferase family protein [Rhodopseudomonas pentothenatexigens]